MGERDIEYFDKLWQDSMPKDGMKHTKETWDKMAKKWLSDAPEVAAKKQELVYSVARYLVENGAITENSSVIDIGCGSGNYSIEFAKSAKEVLGIDISEKMIEYCVESAKLEDVNNVTFVENDFLNFDIEAANWIKNFDLVFTSLTPAMSGADSIKKVNAMSRGYCFNNSFVYRKDVIKNLILQNVFDRPADNSFGNSSPYCLFNILWQMGYFPKMEYYKEIIDYNDELNMEYATQCARGIIRDRDPDQRTILKIYEYLKTIAVDGKIQNKSESLFAWTLWKVEEN